MGQKVNPISFRLGVINTWNSKWFANRREFADLFLADIELRKAINLKLTTADVTKIEIERSAKKVTVNVYAAKPGMIIGKGGVMIEDLKDFLKKKFKQNFDVNIHEITDPDLNALLIGRMVASQIERRIAYRRAVKMSMQKALEAGAKGIKIRTAGRLNGVEISREELFKEGSIPLHTLRANIDYAKAEARTTYGVIGIQVWIYKGLVFKKKQAMAEVAAPKKQ
ncbi:30S ribosomal protein S3 [Candidatus Peregrinibacteria bacterium]|nr:30S ribosomal protein S3 [Candidatus Peregrinibacteria bacterium]